MSSRIMRYTATLDQFVQKVAKTMDSPRVFSDEFLPLAKTFGLYARNSRRGYFPSVVRDHSKEEEYDLYVLGGLQYGEHWWQMILNGVVIPEGLTDPEEIERAYVNISLVSDMQWNSFNNRLQVDLLAGRREYPPFWKGNFGVSFSFDYKKPINITQGREQDRKGTEPCLIPTSKLWFLDLVPQIEAEVKKREQVALAVNQ